MMTVELRDAINLLAQYSITPSAIALLRTSAADPAQPVVRWVRLLGPLTQAQLGQLMGVSASVISRRVKAETDAGSLVIHRLRNGRGGRPMNVVALPSSPVPTQVTVDISERIVTAVLLVLAADQVTIEAIINSASGPHRPDTDVSIVNTAAASPAQADRQLRDDQRSAPTQTPPSSSKALDQGWSPTSSPALHTWTDPWSRAEPLPAIRDGSDYLSHHQVSVPSTEAWNAYRPYQYIRPVQSFRPSVGERLAWTWQRWSSEIAWHSRDMRWQLRELVAEWNIWLLMLIVLAICVGVAALWLMLDAARDLETPDSSIRIARHRDPQVLNGIRFMFAQSDNYRNQSLSSPEKMLFRVRNIYPGV
jgi:hypothetical protein